MFDFSRRDRCPVCSASGGRCLYDEAFDAGRTRKFLETYYQSRLDVGRLARGRYSVLCCDGCGLYYQRDTLTGAGEIHLYEEAISAESSLRKREDSGYAYFRSLLRDAEVIRDLVPGERPRAIEVLDFGMGWGHWTFAAKALGHSAWGAELSPRRVEFAAASGVRIAELNQMPDGFFDYINSDQVLEHVTCLREVTALVARLLKPGGVLKVFVPDGSRLGRVLGPAYQPAKDAIQPLEHVNGFTRASLDRLMADFGLYRIPPSGFASTGRRLHWLARGLTRRQAPDGYFRKQ
ncbi:class I SAM-dependent methyltransferase [Zavarzinia sp.]|uniref:class I SAM-dependent methyltransferase n=1 Tax=Zavarzinia sp. TaxID=2027920 RepID=UPI003561B5FF